jgi:hypothetical protein
VQKNGQLRGYGGGLWRKQHLLDLERRGAAPPHEFMCGIGGEGI